MRDNGPYIVTILAIMAIGLGGIVASLRAANVYPVSPYPLESVLTPTKTYNCEVIVPVRELIKQYDDYTRIMRYVDEDAGVVIYFTVNETGDMVTSMHPIPINSLDVNRNLYKRYK